MSDTSANHPPAVVKPKRGRKPKNKPRTEEENNALAKLMSDLEAMKVSQAARDVENARLNAELVALRAYQSTVLSETRIGQQTISPTPVGGTSSTPDENFDAEAGANNTQVGNQPNENNFQDRRRALESLTSLRENQHEDSTMVTTEKNIPSSEDLPIIPRPKGQAGRDFTLCVKMGLSKSTKGLVTYNALVRNTHRAVHESRIPWDKYEWRNIAAADKALLFAIMRERDPILKRFETDWASECLVRQYIKNLRGKSFRSHTIQRSAKYDYLTANSAQRDQSKSRKSNAQKDYIRRKEKAKEAKEAAKAERRKRRRLRRRVEVVDSDVEMPEFIEGSSGLQTNNGGENEMDVDEEEEEETAM